LFICQPFLNAIESIFGDKIVRSEYSFVLKVTANCKSQMFWSGENENENGTETELKELSVKLVKFESVWN
jgi:hypothetical protein